MKNSELGLGQVLAISEAQLVADYSNFCWYYSSGGNPIGFIRAPVYQAEGIMRFKGRDTTSALTGLGDEFGQLSTLVSEENPINTESSVIKSAPII